jgi:UDP-N-acetylmuramyl pentapeptide synthase
MPETNNNGAPSGAPPSAAKTGEVLPPVNLDALAKQINNDHAAIIREAKSVVMRVIAVGEALIQAKAAVEDGQWLRWLSTTSVPERTAQLWMQIAEYKRQLEAEANWRPATIADQTLNEVIKSMRAKKQSTKKKPKEEEPPKSVALGGAVKELTDRSPTLEDLLANHAADELFAVLKDTWESEQLEALSDLLSSHVAARRPDDQASP